MQSSLDQHNILAMLVFSLVFSDAFQHTDAVHYLLPLVAAVSIYLVFCRLLLYAEGLPRCPVPAGKASPAVSQSGCHSKNEIDSPVARSTSECDRAEEPAPQPNPRHGSKKPGPIRLSEYFAQHPPRTAWIPQSHVPSCPQSKAGSRRRRTTAPLVIIHIRREKPRRAAPFYFPQPTPCVAAFPVQKVPSRATVAPAPKLQPSPPVQLPTISQCGATAAQPQHQVATSLSRAPAMLSLAPAATPAKAPVSIISVPDDMDVDDVGTVPPATTILRPKDVFPPLYQPSGLTCAMLKNIHLARSDEFYAMLAYRAEKRPVFQFGGGLGIGAMEVD
ncbi:hypothetical protein DFH06DRAFT_1385366 [Mycena polygramma]|nr:hypothetical protein DFH06DRAFT_1385366 [Mycena polygramma]